MANDKEGEVCGAQLCPTAPCTTASPILWQRCLRKAPTEPVLMQYIVRPIRKDKPTC